MRREGEIPRDLTRGGEITGGGEIPETPGSTDKLEEMKTETASKTCKSVLKALCTQVVKGWPSHKQDAITSTRG